MDRRAARRESRRADRAEELKRRNPVIADANHARRHLQARMNSPGRSRQEQQVRDLIKREGELAYHDDKRNRKEIDAVIHRASPGN
jgi:hypothetical protein